MKETEVTGLKLHKIGKATTLEGRILNSLKALQNERLAQQLWGIKLRKDDTRILNYINRLKGY